MHNIMGHIYNNLPEKDWQQFHAKLSELTPEVS